MAQNDYRPVSWNGESISNAKLNQMANNTQFIFERQPKMRYTGAGNMVRDTALKVIAGKTPFSSVTTRNYNYASVYFGSFFSVGCKPVITTTLEGTSPVHRARIVVTNLNQTVAEIDHIGFTAVVSTEAYPTLASGGWIHWTAVGY